MPHLQDEHARVDEVVRNSVGLAIDLIGDAIYNIEHRSEWESNDTLVDIHKRLDGAVRDLREARKLMDQEGVGE